MKRPGRKRKIIITTVAVILIFWTALTIWAQYFGEQYSSEYGVKGHKSALIVYNPDPIYDLDKQVCNSFAKGLAETGYHCKVASIRFAEQDTDTHDLYVFCANTYNWSPDWLICKFVKSRQDLENQKAVAITLGSGSTGRAKRRFEEKIKARNMTMIDSRTYWLMRPNDDNRMDEKNVVVANDLAVQWGKEVGNKLNRE